MARPQRLLLLSLLALIAACGGGPPVELFRADVEKMAAVDRGLGFSIQVESVEVVRRSVDDARATVSVRVTGTATHPTLHIGATLPAEPQPRRSWAEWQYFLTKGEAGWVIGEKYKTSEGPL